MGFHREPGGALFLLEQHAARLSDLARAGRPRHRGLRPARIPGGRTAGRRPQVRSFGARRLCVGAPVSRRLQRPGLDLDRHRAVRNRDLLWLERISAVPVRQRECSDRQNRAVRIVRPGAHGFGPGRPAHLRRRLERRSDARRARPGEQLAISVVRRRLHQSRPLRS